MPAVLLLAFVTAERLAELLLARRNTAALMAKGAFEVGSRHYPVIVLLHALWLSGLWLNEKCSPAIPLERSMKAQVSPTKRTRER
jgi:methyltransferase